MGVNLCTDTVVYVSQKLANSYTEPAYHFCGANTDKKL